MIMVLLLTGLAVNAHFDSGIVRGKPMSFGSAPAPPPCTNPTNGGTIAAAQTICHGTAPAEITSTALPSGHSGILEYQWQKSTTSSTSGFAEITSATGTTYQPGALTQTTWFIRLARVACKLDWTGADTSNAVQITVRPEFNPGEIATTGETICYNTNPTITIGNVSLASGGDGNITYSWRSSADGYATDIASASGTTYTPEGPLTTTTSYRRYAKDATCVTTVMPVTGTWTVTVNPDRVYVTESGAGLMDGSTWGNAFSGSQLQTAINTACTEVWVAAGTYLPTSGADRNIAFTIGKGISVFGGFDGTETLLSERDWKNNITTLSGDIGTPDVSTDNSYTLVKIEDATGTVTLDGFHIQKSNHEGGNSGVWVFNSMANIVNCVINDHNAYNFSAIYAKNSVTNIENCEVFNCTGQRTIQNTDTSSMRVTNSFIHDNLYGGGIGNFSADTLLVINTLVTNNTGPSLSGVAFSNHGKMSLINCTVFGNTGYDNAGFYSGPTATVTNSIFWNNNGGGGIAPSHNITYSTVQLGYSGEGNTAAYPLFVSASDFRLRPCSPAVNAGNNAAIPSGITTDLDGDARIFNDTVDMGAYENSDAPVIPARMYVTTTGTGDGSSWANATNDLQAAIDNCATNEIWIAAGTYKPIASPTGCSFCSSPRDFAFLLKDGIKIYGGFAGTESSLSQRVPGNETILSGDIDNNNTLDNGNTNHVVIGAAARDITMDGITIMYCYASENSYIKIGTTRIYRNAGALTISEVNTASFNNIKFKENYSIYGGAVDTEYTDGHVEFNKCTFSNNYGYYGGAVYTYVSGYNYGYTSFDSCTFNDNRGNYGGTLYLDYPYASDTISNCTFTDNYSNYGGAAIFLYATGYDDPLHDAVKILKCQFENNNAGYGGAIYSEYPYGNDKISDCQFTQNKSRYGGAIYLYESGYNEDNYTSVLNCHFDADSSGNGGAIYSEYSYGNDVIANCTFENTISASYGGAIYLYESGYNGTNYTKITDCVFTGCESAAGGAIYSAYAYGNDSILNSQFISNTASGHGGAVYLDESSYNGNNYSTLTNCLFEGNTSSGYGGAVYSSGGNGNRILSSIFKENEAVYGGGVSMFDETGIISNSLFSENKATNNQANTGAGGAIYGGSANLQVSNSTFEGNIATLRPGGAITNENSLTLKNCILWGNQQQGAGTIQQQQVYNDGGIVNIGFSIVQDTLPDGATNDGNNIYRDPLFSDAINGDYTLALCSPAINAGTNPAVPSGITTDLNGNPRFYNSGTVDMGAYEFQADKPTNPDNGGEIAANQTICYNDVPSGLTSISLPTGYIGTLEYQWQSSVIRSDSGFVDIGSATGTTYAPSALTQTTWYRRMSRVECDTTWPISSASNVVEITVYAEFTAGAIPDTGETICYSSNPTEIPSTTDASGGDGSITYSWRSSADSYATDISGATGSTYTPAGPLTSTTSYRRYAKDATCVTTLTPVTETWTVTVLPEFTPGAIASTGETICYNTNPATAIGNITLASGGDGSITYSWRSSADSYASEISGATGSTYTPAGPLTTSTSYRRYIKDGTCFTSGTPSTGTWTVTVSPASAGGVVSGGGQVCTGTNSTVLTLIGNTGAVLMWQYSTDNTNWTDISGHSQTTYTAVDLTTDTWFRAVVESSPCPQTYSEADQITMASDFSISGYAKYENNPYTPLSGLKITLKKNGLPQGTPVVTGANGYYEFTGLDNGTYSLDIASSHPSGQWQTWGGVNNTDYLLVSKHIAGTQFLPVNPPVIKTTASVKLAHPVINNIDATAIRQAAKFPTTGYSYFDTTKWVFSGVDASNALNNIAVGCSDVVRDIRGLCAGDVNGSYVPASGYKAAEPGLELVHRGVLPISDEIIFPVRVDRTMELGAMTLFLDFDPSVMIVTNVTTVTTITNSPELWYNVSEPTLNLKPETLNTLQIGWMSLEPVSVAEGQAVILIHARLRDGVETHGRASVPSLAHPIRFTLNENPLSELANGEGEIIGGAILEMPEAKAKVAGISPDEFILSVFPNPSNQVVYVDYLLTEDEMVDFTLTNSQGVTVLKADRNLKAAGAQRESFDVSGFTPGVYMLKATAGTEVSFRKLVVVR